MNPSNGSRFALDRVADEAPPPDWLPPESQRHPTVYPGSDLHERPGRRTRRIRLLTLDDLDKLPRLEWLVGKLVPARGLVVLYGPPDSAKSFLALDLALSVATGECFHGHVVRRGGAAYVVGEGRGGFGDRVRAWRSVREGLGLKGFRIVHEEVSLSNPDDVSALLEALDELPEFPALVAFDSLSQCLGNADENLARDMAGIVRAVGRLQERGASVLVIHHVSRATGTPRGSTALEAAADAAIKVSKTGSRVRVRPTKLRDAPLGTELDLRLEAVVDRDDRLVSWRLVSREPEPDASEEGDEATGDLEARALDFLAGGWRSFSEVQEVLSVRYATAKDAVLRLADKRIVEDNGEPDDRRRRWRAVPGEGAP